MYWLNNKGPWLILLAAHLCIIYTLPHDSTECGVADTAYKINLNSDCAHISPKLFCKCIYDPDTSGSDTWQTASKKANNLSTS